jgi:hypothetical protein
MNATICAPIREAAIRWDGGDAEERSRPEPAEGLRQI